MVSLISLSHNFLSFSSSPSSSIHKARFLIPPRRQQQQQHPVDLVVFKKTASLGVPCLFQRSSGLGFGRRRRKTKVWEGEGNPDLEAEILEFMKISRNPNLFPSKEELIVSGRLDLVQSIVRQGGWLSSGWGMEEVEEEYEQEQEQEQEQEHERAHQDWVQDETSDSRIFQTRFDGGGTLSESTSLKGFEAGTNGVPSSASPSSDSSSPSFSGRMEGEDNAGIEGILSRLEKQRTWSLGSKDKESKARGTVNDVEEYMKGGTPEDHSSESGSSVPWSSGKDLFDDSAGMHVQSGSFPGGDESIEHFKPDMWRKWSHSRTGHSEGEFEAAEFGDIIRNDKMVRKDRNETDPLRTELCSGNKEKDFSQIRSRLKHLELEMASVLRVVSSQTDKLVSDKNLKDSSETDSLSDAWEFRETEVMKARDKLRSLRAQLAVLEGKMALKILEAHKMVEVKQKKINATRKTLSLLRTACIVWSKPASEVLLMGSFDGWTSQRVMEKTSSGIFSLYLRLYPGQYEVKFIVDGEWKIDPLRPVVKNNGHQNNLITIS